MDSEVVSRRYRSRKQKPCDSCRRRRVCCVREEGTNKCSLCRARGIECTFISQPSPKWKHGSTGPGIPQNKQPRGRTTYPNSGQTLQYIGLSGDQDPNVLIHSTWNRSSSTTSGVEWSCYRVSADPRIPEHFGVVPEQHLDTHPHYYPSNKVEDMVQPYKAALLKAFFSVVNSSYPVLDEKSFDQQAASAILLASMYALAHPFCLDAQCLNPWSFLDFTGRAIPLESRSANLDTIEAALLYSQRHAYIVRAPAMPGMTAEIGSLVGISHDVGLNVDPTNWDISATEKKRRKRLWWAVHIQDKWTALTLGRPAYLNDDQSNVPMITLSEFDIDELDQNPSSDMMKKLVAGKMFVGMATLSVILSDILNSLYTVKAVHKHQESSGSIDDIVVLATGFGSRLDDWKAQHLSHDMAHRTFPDPTGTLYLAYFTTEIIIWRAVLRNHHNNDVARQRGATMALSVLELLRMLQVNRLRAFWWAASRINFAIAGSFMFNMLLTSEDDGEADLWISHIKEYQTLLREQSIGFDVTRLASVRMDLLTKAGIGTESTDMSKNTAESSKATDSVDHVQQSPTASILERSQMSQDYRDTSLSDYQIGDKSPMNGNNPFNEDDNWDWIAAVTYYNAEDFQQI